MPVPLYIHPRTKAIFFVCLLAGLVCIAPAAIAQTVFLNAPVHAVGDVPCAIAVADFNDDGTSDVLTVDRYSDSVSVLLNSATHAFDPGGSWKVGDTPLAVVLADFDHSGQIDAAVANYWDGYVSILFGQGDGSFHDEWTPHAGAVPTTYSLGGPPSSIVSADFNKDTWPDLATANGTTGVFVLINDGDGSFAAPAKYKAADMAQAVVAADFDNDTNPDLAIGDQSGNRIVILWGNGTGTFPSSTTLPSVPGIQTMTTGDFDANGLPDIALTSDWYADLLDHYRVTVLLNTAGRTFAPPVDHDVAESPYAIVTADFNHDNRPDIAVAHEYPSAATILMNRGDGTFTSPTMYNTGAWSRGLAALDIDNDGNKDLVAGNQNAGLIGDGRVTALYGIGDGTFRGAPAYNTNVRGYARDDTDLLIAQDMDGDHDIDIVTGGLYLSVFTNTAGSLGRADIQNLGARIRGVAFQDLNGDTYQDTAILSDRLWVSHSDSEGHFAAPTQYATSNNANTAPTAMAMALLNNDAYPDIAVTNYYSPSPGAHVSTLAIMHNDTHGAFTLTYEYNVGSRPVSIAAGDIDGDTDVDLLLADEAGGNMIILRNNGDGAFGAPSPVATASTEEPTRVLLANLDGQNGLDAVVTGGKLSVLLNDGAGNFPSANIHDVGTSPSAVVTLDIDKDGDNDLVVANRKSNTVSALRNNGDGTFAGAVEFMACLEPIDLVAADFDGDGQTDVAVVGHRSNTIVILHNQGESAARFGENQTVHVETDGTFWLGLFNYETLEWFTSLNGGLADTTLDYTLPTEQWVGGFLYDYAAGAYLQGFYILRGNWW